MLPFLLCWKVLILLTLYRSPFQLNDEFDNFISKFEDNLFSITSKKLFLTCILGGFNAKSSGWRVHIESSTESLTSYSVLTKVIN